MGAYAYSQKKAGIKDVRALEIPIIDVDNKIDNLLHAINNVGVASHHGFRTPFWSKVEILRKDLKVLEVQWKEDVDRMYVAAQKHDVKNILHYRTLAYTNEKNFETILIQLAANILSELGRIPDMKKWLVRLREEMGERNKLANRIKRDLGSL